MSKTAVLFTGIKLPFKLLEEAVNWAKQSNSVLFALFLRSADVNGEGYVFPSDLDEAETLNTSGDAEQSHEKIIQANILLVKNRATSSVIEFQVHVLTDPAIDELEALLMDCKPVFIALDYEQQGLLWSDPATLTKYVAEHAEQLKLVNVS
ncbi:MAG: hypothetical protein ABWZ25_18560 [Chitinophagaceae bacterium]